MDHVVLLRGINVGGINIKMADLRAALVAAGFENVKTVLATGNVSLSSPQSGSTLKKSIESTLSKAFGYEAWVIVLDEPALRAIVDGYPYDPEREGWHPYVIFGNNADHLAELADIAGSLDPALEQLSAGHGVLYWEVVKGNTTDSAVGKLTAKAKYKPTTTTRNLRTLVKMLA
ncbi:DUF1697 domain-containing protein [Rhodococcus sp. G-MC3]|uniref:DUF1697 domain-containing protein n=1 Tax=Rhodococcus sp. G-MC3 TaxID=3046209 RepID=UPI0024B9038E|nr:DUF1697 domain-containing protein [Rhodococcus sp. G-MC3]MDJ0393008.1 DUF1697 domain-containing protein [Rhodococcus sp. G-MC3]